MSTAPSAFVADTEQLPYGIVFDGRGFHYREYRYELLQDAIQYAELERRRPGFVDTPQVAKCWKRFDPPTPEQQSLMKEAGIVYLGARYCYGPYRYDLLDDALNYAKRVPGLGNTPAHT